MTALGWTLAAALASVAAAGLVLLLRWLHKLEAGRIEAVAARRGWTVDGGAGPHDWRVEGSDAGRRWVLGVRHEPGRPPWTELTVAVEERPFELFAAPATLARRPEALGWVRDLFGVEPGPRTAAVTGVSPGWVAASDDGARATELLAREADALRALRPTIARRDASLRLRLQGEERDGRVLEALIDLGLRLARA